MLDNTKVNTEEQVDVVVANARHNAINDVADDVMKFIPRKLAKDIK